jgi:chitin disaccharide deacetylase
MATDRPAISLVVNADEFGLSTEVSRGILLAHREGIVTSTSVLGNCGDLPGVQAALAEAPTLGVGIQLTLVRGGPVSDAAAIPSLVDQAGRFPGRAREVYFAWLAGRLRPVEIEREFDAQVRRAREAGLRPDHLNTQHHIGFIPPVGLAVEAVARRYGIPGVRSAVEQPTLSWVAELPRGAIAAVLGGLAWLTRRQMGALRHGPETWGYVESGQLDEIRILEILGRLSPGSHELICHPGLADDPATLLGTLSVERSHRARELAALTSPLVKQALGRLDVRLCRWADLF